MTNLFDACEVVEPRDAAVMLAEGAPDRLNAVVLWGNREDTNIPPLVINGTTVYGRRA